MEFGNPQTLNAKIKFTFLGIEENRLCYQLGFDIQGNLTVLTDKVFNVDIPTLLNTLEVRSWEELPRKFARIKVDGKRVVAVGNLIEDRWIKWNTI